jgi:hypothetical protein
MPYRLLKLVIRKDIAAEFQNAGQPRRGRGGNRSGYRIRKPLLILVPSTGSFDDSVGPNPAITLSRKDWHSSANGAVL